MTNSDNSLKNGLTSKKAAELLQQYGKNELNAGKKESFFKKALHIICEPMFLLLIAAAVIYFILGEPRDGAIMLVFVIGIISIDIIQEWKTDKTLNALKDLSAPHATVIRDGMEISIPSSDIVPGDVMLITEGGKIPADGKLLRSSDLSVDEASLTGESEPVRKVLGENDDDTSYWKKDYCYAGTLVTQGSGYVLVDKTGGSTEYGKIGTNIAAAPKSDTPLQKQTGRLVKLCAGIAAVFFALVSVITYFNVSDLVIGDRIIQSILSGITLSMAMIPEEFPVILTVFLSMGAWRLAKKQSLARSLPAVETLGAVSVLCVDKTGTITMNQMTVQDTWVLNEDNDHLCETMGLACETTTYDPMEKAMLAHCEKLGISVDHIFGGKLIDEYPFTNELKMMGHIWHHDGEIIIAAKGSPEQIMTISKLTQEEILLVNAKIDELSQRGLRVIAVGEMHLTDEADIPKEITGCKLTLCGLIGLADPPRESVKGDIKACVEAGIRVVMITGDNGVTAQSIARQVGIPNCDNVITGKELDEMTDQELKEQVKTVSVFSRVIPEHKMRIVKAFKDNGEVVAMTGDGVNDAPALKYADIGIAMGKRGSEVSREAADLILLDDNFSTIVHTVRDGRRIYDNIRKAIGYVFTIHIPIAFASLLAPLLNIPPSALLLLPLHVVLLELIIDPTCSIVLERQPAEQDIMKRKPRNPNENILTKGVLIKSIIQGIVIFIASFGLYYLTLKQGSTPELARSMGIATVILSNLFLVFVNSSSSDFAISSVRRLLKDKVMWSVVLGTIAIVALVLYTPLNSFLKLAPLNGYEIATSIIISIVAVFWYELVKAVGKLKRRKR